MKPLHLLEEIGAGSFGSVFKARAATGEIVAVKMIDGDVQGVDGFLREISLLSSIEHRNIVRYYESYHEGSMLHLVMELIHGVTLSKLLTHTSLQGVPVRQPLSEKQALSVLFELLQALEFLHQNEIIHRDLKSQNVMISSDGRVVLLDFGVAGRIDGLTQRRTFCGTLFYMPPELFSDVPITHSWPVDIWALGALAYELAVGEPPYTDIRSEMLVIDQIRQGRLPDLPSDSDFSMDYQQLIRDACRPSPSKRPSASILLQSSIFNVVRNDHRRSKRLKHLVNPFLSTIVTPRSAASSVSSRFASLKSKMDLHFDFENSVDCDSEAPTLHSSGTTDIDIPFISQASIDEDGVGATIIRAFDKAAGSPVLTASLKNSFASLCRKSSFFAREFVLHLADLLREEQPQLWTQVTPVGGLEGKIDAQMARDAGLGDIAQVLLMRDEFR